MSDVMDMLLDAPKANMMEDLQKQMAQLTQMVHEMDQKVNLIAHEILAPVQVRRDHTGRAAQIRKGSRTLNVKRAGDGSVSEIS